MENRYTWRFRSVKFLASFRKCVCVWFFGNFLLSRSLLKCSNKLKIVLTPGYQDNLWWWLKNMTKTRKFKLGSGINSYEGKSPTNSSRDALTRMLTSQVGLSFHQNRWFEASQAQTLIATVEGSLKRIFTSVIKSHASQQMQTSTKQPRLKSKAFCISSQTND